MHCFYHEQIDSVAVCKSCYRALCHGCLVQGRGGISCRGPCEEAVALMGSVMERGMSNLRTARTAQQRSSLLMALMGLAMLATGLWQGPRMLSGIGVVCLFGAFLYYLNARELKK